MSDSLLEFPCSFPIKMMGLDEPAFRDLAVSLVAQHVDDIADTDVRTSHSSNGRYIAVTVTIEAQSQHQLDSIYADLTANDKIKVAL